LPVERSISPVRPIVDESFESPRLTFDREELLSEADRDPEALAVPARDEDDPPPEFEREPPESLREELPELALLELLELDERLLSEPLLELLLGLDEWVSELPLGADDPPPPRWPKSTMGTHRESRTTSIARRITRLR
jgi:hypothetical protein